MLKPSWNPNPWVKGFRPPAKCPNCKRLYTLVFTGKRDQFGNHIYYCTFCHVFVGAPTDYAYCNRFNEIERIEKDVFYNPCRDCPYRKVAPGHGVCIHFRKYHWYGDMDIADAIEKTFKKIRKSKLRPTEPYRRGWP